MHFERLHARVDNALSKTAEGLQVFALTYTAQSKMRQHRDAHWARHGRNFLHKAL